MSTRYTIIQYVPDPVTDERMNIGLVVIDGEHRVAAMRFLRHWRRARTFGDEDPKFLQEFVKSLEIRQRELLGLGKVWTAEDVTRAVKNWHHSIQFTEFRASLQQPDELADDLAARFLREPMMQAAQEYMVRTDVLKLGARHLRQALRSRFGVSGAALVKTRYSLAGRLSTHHFDLVAGNGQPQFAAQAVSLAISDQRQIEKDINSAGWSIQDVKERDDQFPAAIIAIIPSSESVLDGERQQNVDRLTSVAKDLNVPVIPEAGIPAWAQKMAATVTLHH